MNSKTVSDRQIRVQIRSCPPTTRSSSTALPQNILSRSSRATATWFPSISLPLPRPPTSEIRLLFGPVWPADAHRRFLGAFFNLSPRSIAFRCTYYMAIQPRAPKNIWVAAGDGDLDRVRELIEQDSLSPNMPDSFTYTPIHAAASYGQIHVLEYLLSRGGDVNITDSDGDTPLYTVENIETARYLVQHGAVVARQNLEGVSPIDHLTEDFPQIADYLRSTLDPSIVPVGQTSTAPSQHSQNLASEQLTSALMSSVQDIMERAEADGRDPEEELRQAVSRTVLEGVLTGFEMSTDDEDARGEAGQDSAPSKRSRTDEGTG